MRINGFSVTLVSFFTVLLACVAVKAVKADTINIGTTTEAENWKVFYLDYDGMDGKAYLEMTKRDDAANQLYKRYENRGAGSEANLMTYKSDDWPMAQENGQHSQSGGYDFAYGWRQAEEGYSWIGTDFGDGGHEAGNQVGYYAFVYTFTAPETVEAMKYLIGGICSDNDLFGVFLNGMLLDGFKDVSFDETGHDKEFGNFDMSYLQGQFNLYADDDNTIVFLVGNAPNIFSSDGLDGVVNTYLNPVGLYSNLQFSTVRPDFVDDKTTTPEPATFLILGLGICGLPLTRRFRTTTHK